MRLYSECNRRRTTIEESVLNRLIQKTQMGALSDDRVFGALLTDCGPTEAHPMPHISKKLQINEYRHSREHQEAHYSDITDTFRAPSAVATPPCLRFTKAIVFLILYVLKSAPSDARENHLVDGSEKVTAITPRRTALSTHRNRSASVHHHKNRR